MKININGVTYAYMRDGAGQPLVLLHGFTGSKNNWHPIIEGLQSRFELIAIDLVGHGETDNPSDYERYSIANSANDIVTLLQHFGITTFNLLGYSMGGRLALYIATHYPKRINALILESASPGLKTETERTQRRISDERLANEIESRGIQWFVDYWERLPLWDSQKQLADAVRDDLHNQRLSNDAQGLANSLRGTGTGVQPSLWERLPTVKLPVKLIVGELDKKFLSINQEMQRLIPNARLSIIPQAGHTTHVENPHMFIDVIQAFL